MKNDNTLMNHAADNIRILAAAMVEISHFFMMQNLLVA